MSLRENRRHQRVDVAIDVRVTRGDRASVGKLSNLSRGGAGLRSETDFGGVGDRIELAIPLPGGIEVTVTSEVVRKNERDGALFYGLRFDSLESNLQSHLLSLIETLIRHSTGDQRKYARVYRRIPIRYRHLSELGAVLENISMGGISMIVDRPHVLHDAIDVAVPDLVGGEFMTLGGKIVHQSPVRTEDGPRYRIGIEFNAITDGQKNALHGLILRILDAQD